MPALPPVITDTSPASMAQCIEENRIACVSLFAASRNGVHEDGGITTIITGIPISDFNGVFRTQLPADLPPDQLDARISVTLRDLDAAGAPYGWHVFPSARPSTLADHLRAHGLRLDSASPGMAVDLQALDDSAPAPEGLMIEPVRDTVALRTWNHTGFAGFGLPEALEEAFYTYVSQFDLSASAPTQLYVGWLGDQPVATAVGLLAAGVVGLYNISTLAEQRGKGIGAAMTLAALSEARARGYRIGILEASKMGFPVYQRLGFRQYITIEHYEPRDAAH